VGVFLAPWFQEPVLQQHTTAVVPLQEKQIQEMKTRNNFIHLHFTKNDLNINSNLYSTILHSLNNAAADFLDL